MESNSIDEIEGVELFKNVDLSKYTTIKLANTGSIAIVKHVDSLRSLLLYLTESNIEYHLVGWGANQVLLNSEDVLFIKLEFEFDKSLFNYAREKYRLPASFSLNMLTSHAKKFGLKGWEVFTGVPASLGGAICMNAGTSLGEIGPLIESVEIMDSKGLVKVINWDQTCFKYRNNNVLNDGDIIVYATIKHFGIDKSISKKISDYLEYRKKTQPLTTKNCGSVFKNYSPNIRAGETIDILGLKEFGFDYLKVSQKHANFVENYGEGSALEFKNLVECLKIDMERYTGLKFELEVKVY